MSRLQVNMTMIGVPEVGQLYRRGRNGDHVKVDHEDKDQVGDRWVCVYEMSWTEVDC